MVKPMTSESSLKTNFKNSIHKFLKENKTLLALVGFVLLIRMCFFDFLYIPTGSMNPIIPTSSVVFTNKTYYGIQTPIISHYLFQWKKPQSGDIVLAKSPQGTRIVKRVIAVGGDKVLVKNGHIQLNGQWLSHTQQEERASFQETFSNGQTATILITNGGKDDYPLTEIPKGKVLLMGDNRDNSYDGRYFGLVDERFIYGKLLNK